MPCLLVSIILRETTLVDCDAHSIQYFDSDAVASSGNFNDAMAGMIFQTRSSFVSKIYQLESSRVYGKAAVTVIR